jgi:hypothetical protein
MKVWRWTNEHLVYLLAFITAALLRFLLLDHWPLSDAESVPALQALEMARGSLSGSGPGSGQVMLTGLLFWLLGDSNFAARFLSALAGSLIVFAPFFFRQELGKKAALLLAFGLALDPGLVAFSRQTASPMWAASMTLLGIGAWHVRKPGLAGIFWGLALLGGPALWQGVVILGAGWLLFRWSTRSNPRTGTEYSGGNLGSPTLTAILSAGITVVLASTLFFRASGGLSGVGASLSSFVAGWSTEATMRPYQWLLLLVLYEILPLVLGLASAVRGWVRGLVLEQFLSLMVLAALIIGLLYPARSPDSLIWVILPLWGLAAREAVRLLAPVSQDRYAHAAHTGLTTCILIFMVANLASLVNELPFRDDTVTTRMAILLGAGALLLVISILVSFGWSTGTALSGMVKGGLTALLLYNVAVATGGSGLRTMQTSELWFENRSHAQIGLLAQTANDLSKWQTGQPGTIDLVVVNADTPALRWALRDYSQASFVAAMDPLAAPALVITPADQQLGLGSSYRGQDFVIVQAPRWQNLQTLDWMNWFIFRKMVQDSTSVILWARSDLFPEGAVPTGITPPE